MQVVLALFSKLLSARYSNCVFKDHFHTFFVLYDSVNMLAWFFWGGEGAL